MPDWKDLMPFEHREPISCVTYSLDEAAHISASRANFRRQIFSRRMLVRLAVFFVVVVAAGAAIDLGTGSADSYWLALVLGIEFLVIVPALFLALYAAIPRRARRLLRQSSLWNSPVEACWSAAGLVTRVTNGATELAWRDYYGWHPAAVGFLLHFNDQQYQIIPAEALSEQQQEGLRAILEASGLKRL